MIVVVDNGFVVVVNDVVVVKVLRQNLIILDSSADIGLWSDDDSLTRKHEENVITQITTRKNVITRKIYVFLMCMNYTLIFPFYIGTSCTQTHTRTHTRTNAHARTHTHAHIHTHTYAHTQIHIRTYTHNQRERRGERERERQRDRQTDRRTERKKESKKQIKKARKKERDRPESPHRL